MMEMQQARLLPDGKRLHLSHGPIELVIEAFGPRDEIEKAYASANICFDGLLQELVDELPLLRQPLSGHNFSGAVAQRMAAAVMPFAKAFITPMAAVAGAVADHILAAMLEKAKLRKVYVNNGGDIALWLAVGETFTSALVDDVAKPYMAGRFTINAGDNIGGIATSGHKGRSFSMGIADSVSVLARNAALADAAATMIGNGVDLANNSKISREPACLLDPDSDLGARLVTVDVAELNNNEVKTALNHGQILAQNLLDRGVIKQAVITLQKQVKIITMPARHLAES